MNELTELKESITSLEIAKVISRPHNQILKAIRKMDDISDSVGLGKFAQTYYKDKQGRSQPCYDFTKSQSLFVLTKFDDEARAKLILRWEELEKENIRLTEENLRLSEENLQFARKELSTLATKKGSLILNPLAELKQTAGFKIIDYNPELQHVSIVESNDLITVIAHSPRACIPFLPEFSFSQSEVKVLETINLRDNIAIEIVNLFFNEFRKTESKEVYGVVNETWIDKKHIDWLLTELKNNICED